jgi:hypothetical protein
MRHVDHGIKFVALVFVLTAGGAEVITLRHGSSEVSTRVREAALLAVEIALWVASRGLWRLFPFNAKAALVIAAPSMSSLGLKLFMLAQASIKVPSTEKCSSDSSALTYGNRGAITQAIL